MEEYCFLSKMKYSKMKCFEYEKYCLVFRTLHFIISRERHPVSLLAHIVKRQALGLSHGAGFHRIINTTLKGTCMLPVNLYSIPCFLKHFLKHRILGRRRQENKTEPCTRKDIRANVSLLRINLPGKRPTSRTGWLWAFCGIGTLSMAMERYFTSTSRNGNCFSRW